MLNHGSFGACPRAVLQRQERLRRQMEADPMRFFTREMEPLLDASRQSLAELLSCDPADLVFVRNVTEAVNAVLRSLRFRPGDEILVTDHAYNACRNVVDYVAECAGAKATVANIPVPIQEPGEIVAAILARVTAQTRLAMIDHVTSPTAVVFPIESIVRALDEQGVDTLVDGAHAPGMVPLDLPRIGAAYYAGNCHKWLCSPVGAGFLHVRPDKQEGIHPAVISHGFNRRRADRPRLHEEFDWTGTGDPTPWLCVGEAIRFLAMLDPGGIEGLIERNHRMAVDARRLLLGRAAFRPVCPEEMLGSMAAIDFGGELSGASAPVHPLQAALWDRFGIEVPVYFWPAPPQLVLRISAQAYNARTDYERLAEALETLLR
jgi:isopenicillin-N epimerase